MTFCNDFSKINAAELRNLLRCDSESGLLFWRPRSSAMFKHGRRTAKGNCNNWNARYAGKEAFTATMPNGYRVGRLFKKNFLAHRVIWCMSYGDWPKKEIDHINGVRDDNRLINLREATRAENNRNRKCRFDNSSGTCGVYWREDMGKWIAQITAGYRTVHLGTFSQKLEAIAARKAAEREHGFHENHGRKLSPISANSVKHADPIYGEP